MKDLVFFLEEPSARYLLEGLLARILPEGTSVTYLIFEGKQDLEKQLLPKLRGWRRPNCAFVVLRDQDSGDCRIIKKKLAELVRESGREPSLVRVACKELEAWGVGDWVAVAEAFDMRHLKAQSVKETYRDPDKLSSPVEALRKFIPDYQKGDGARRVGVLLDPARNHSRSFLAFCSGVQKLVAEPPP